MRQSRLFASRSSLHIQVLPLLLLPVLFVSGCGGDDGEGESDAKARNRKPQTISVSSAVANLQPDEFEFTVPRELPANELNAWGQVHLQDLVDLEANRRELGEALKVFLSEEQVRRVFREEFSQRDAAHLRDMIWAKIVVRSIIGRSTNPLESSVKLFNYVVQNVMLVSDDAHSLPLGPFDTIMLGRGRAADRAWVFATLVRQLRLPFVVIDASLPAGTEHPPFIGGVQIEDRVHLFDLRYGSPLPGPGEDGSELLISNPGTLAELSTDATPLRHLDIDEERPYPVTAEHLQQARLLVAGDTSLWSRRMQGLENALTGELSTVVYAALVSDGDYTGDLDRLRESLGDSAKDRIGIWNRQDDMREAREELDEEQQKQFNGLRDPLRAPVPFLVTEIKSETESDISFPQDARMHERARINHVLCRVRESIPVYLKLQGWKNMPPATQMRRDPDQERMDSSGKPRSKTRSARPSMMVTLYDASGQPEEYPIEKIRPDVIQRLMPDEILLLHARAAEEAQFWRACCQMHLENYESAARDFDRFLRQSPRSSLSNPARFLSGIALAHSGRVDRGASFIGSVSPDSPLYPAARVLARRWKTITETRESESGESP